MIAAEKHVALGKALTSIRERFLTRLKDQLLEFDILMFDIESGENVNESLATIKAGAHKVAGLAGSMGFQELGSAALKVDELVLRAMQVGQTNAERQHLIETIDRFLNCCDEAITTLSDDPI